MNARPDEMAMMSEIEQDRDTRKNIHRGVKTAAQIGVAAGGGALLNKVAPFLSPYLTEDIAMKGISKVAPKIGDFLKSGMNQGLTLKSGLDFLKENMPKPKEENKNSKTNILDQYSPELREFIEEKINRGFGHKSAALLAQDKKEFKDIIDKIKQDHKLEKNFGFSDLIKSLYDTGLAEDQSKAALQEPEQMQQPEQGQQPQQPQEPQQGGQGQQALMAILDKINKRIGG